MNAGKLVVKAQYLCSMKESNNCFWDQHPQNKVIMVPTCTILHPQVDVTIITDIHDKPKSVCNRTQSKEDISRHHICLTDSNYEYISEEIDLWDKIDFEKDVDVLNEEENCYEHFKLIVYVFLIYLYIHYQYINSIVLSFCFCVNFFVWIFICMQSIYFFNQ